MSYSGDHSLDTLLALNGEQFEIQEGYWVKFVINQTEVSKVKPHGLNYSLSYMDLTIKESSVLITPMQFQRVQGQERKRGFSMITSISPQELNSMIMKMLQLF